MVTWLGCFLDLPSQRFKHIQLQWSLQRFWLTFEVEINRLFLFYALQTDPFNTQNHIPVLVSTQTSIKWEIRTYTEDSTGLCISHLRDLQHEFMVQ